MDCHGGFIFRTNEDVRIRSSFILSVCHNCDSSSIRARCELDSIRELTLSQLRFNSICARFELDSSIREKNEHVQFFPLSNRIGLESSSNRIESSVTITIRARFEVDSIRFENSVTIAIRFDMRSIRARFEHSRISYSRIESQLWQGSRIESSSNRYCDRRFTAFTMLTALQNTLPGVMQHLPRVALHSPLSRSVTISWAPSPKDD